METANQISVKKSLERQAIDVDLLCALRVNYKRSEVEQAIIEL